MKLFPALLIAGIRFSAQLEPTIKVDVRQVLVPVVVTEHSDRYVQGLQLSDFQVYEDGVLQPIVAFSAETAAPALSSEIRQPSATKSATPSSSPTNVAKRMFVICFDTVHTSFASLVRARKSLDKLFEREHGSGATFALISLGTQLQIVQTATPDSSLIRTKIESEAFTRTYGSLEISGFLSEINQVKATMDSFCGQCADSCGREAVRKRDTCEIKLQQIRSDLDIRAQRWSVRSAAFLSGFERLVSELSKIEGPRALLLISDGFALRPGAEFYAIASAYVPNSPSFQFDPPYNLQPDLERGLKIAARNNIIVYTIDSRGVDSPAFRPGGIGDASGTQVNPRRGGMVLTEIDSKWTSLSFQNSSVLTQLASGTGGLFLQGSNDLQKQFHRAFTDGLEYYLLSYQPTNVTQDGKFRRIEVKVKGKHREVRAKSGYWAEGQVSR